MVTDYDLYSELQSLTKQLQLTIKSLRKTAQEYAEADRSYYITKTEELVKMRERGEPVTYISQAIKGVKPVANARMKMIIAEAMYEANKEAIYSIKLQMKLIESQIQREYADGGKGSI